MHRGKWRVKLPLLAGTSSRLVRTACPMVMTCRGSPCTVLGGLMERERGTKKDFSMHSPGAGGACPHRQHRATAGKGCLHLRWPLCHTQTSVPRPEVAGAESKEAHCLSTCLVPCLPYLDPRRVSALLGEIYQWKFTKLLNNDLIWPVRIWEKMTREVRCD